MKTTKEIQAELDALQAELDENNVIFSEIWMSF